MTNKHFKIAKNQSGVVLVISLIMLLALTLIGVTSSSVTGLETKMAANSKDINLAFQAAEAALRDAENFVGAANYANTIKPKFNRAATNANQGVGGYYTLFNNDEIATDTSTPTLKVPQPQNDTSLPEAQQKPFYSWDIWDPAANPKKYITYDNGSTVKKLIGIYYPPEYIIEEIGSAGADDGGNDSLEVGTPEVASTARVISFRITARGWGSNANSVVTVQAIAKVTY